MRTVVALLAMAAAAAAAGLPKGWTLKGECETNAERLCPTDTATITAPIQAPQAIELAVGLGKTDLPLFLRAAGEGRTGAELKLEAKDLRKSAWHWNKEMVKDAGADVWLRLHGKPWIFRNTFWVRPNPHFYHKDDLKRAIEGWDALPAATAHVFRLRIEADPQALRVWLDDRYLGRVDIAAKTLTLSMKLGHSLAGASVGPLQATGRLVPIRLGGYRRAGRVGATTVSIPAGRQTLGGVPFEVAAPAESIDVGLSRWLMEATGPDDFTDDYYTRSAFDGTPESILLAVPTADYTYAHLLCAVDPDPAKTPVLTLRLTRLLGDSYDSGGRGDAFADTAIRLEPSEGKWPEGVKRVGEAVLDTPAGKKRVPLLHVRVPLRSGHIQDVLDEEGTVYRRSTHHLDLELTKEVHQVVKQNYANFSTKPLGRPSGARVFALTLERAPVRVRLRPTQVGNVFYADEPRAFDVELASPAGSRFEGEARCEVVGVAEPPKPVVRKLAVEPGQASTARLDAGALAPGWYQALVRVSTGGECFWETPTTFAVLPAAARGSKGDPRFGVWWFRRSHVGTDSVDDVAPLLARMGVRHVCPGGRGPSGAELAKHGLAISMFPNKVRGNIEKAEEAIDVMVKDHPDCKWAVICHENGFGEKLVFPPEFIGKEPPKLTEDQEKRFKATWDKAVAVSRIYRRKHPHIKLIFGNSSLPFAVEFMRRGYPREFVDAFGDEDLGQLIMPEFPPPAFKSIYWQRQYQKLYKYDVPVTSCYEWRCHPTTPGNLTGTEQAELYARDALHALAFGMPHVNLGLLHDVGDAYYYSRWGGTGLCRRYPLLTPKPSYVALATLIAQLGGARFRRYLTASSPSLYVLEFEKGGQLVYALWLPRGRRQVALTLDRKPNALRLTQMLGAEAALDASTTATVAVSSSPSYLRVEGGARITKAVGGPATCEAPPAKRTVVDPLDDPARWTPVAERDAFLETAHFDFPRRQGTFQIGAVDDEQKGKALSVKLLPQPDVPAPCPRYLILTPKAPLPIPGRPAAIGTWVKGNSSWGRVMWEVEDAKGERFFAISAGEGGWLVGDWRTRTYINFDGWNYLQVRLPTWYSSGFYGPERRNWRNTGGDGRVDYPIRFTRLVLELRDRVVHLTDMVPVPDPEIRLRELSVSGE